MKGRRIACKLCWLWFLVINTHAFAQEHFTCQALLDSLLQSGFYNIALSPGIVAKCKKDMEDLRLKESKGTEVPYLLYTESSRPNEDAFTEFPLSYSDDRTTVYINNILPNSLDKLFLLIKNSEAKRAAMLSGSDDQSHWFVMKENIILQREYAAGNDAFVQSVSFPKTSYKYFRITMPGKNVLPLHIVKAGVYRNSFTNSVFDTLPAPQIVQKDSSDTRSYIYLSFGESYVIDKLVLSVSGSRFYKRAIALYNKNTINPSLTIDAISSAMPATIDFHAKTNRLLLVIDNKDNAPLAVTAVTALQLHTSVTAYLEKDKSYALYFGDSAAFAPSYDLQYFDDSIGSNIQPLRIKSIIRLDANAVKKESKGEVGTWILWSIILAVLASLISVSLRMMRDINNKKEDNADL